jgi:hypothetical protein
MNAARAIGRELTPERSPATAGEASPQAITQETSVVRITVSPTQ